MPPAPSSAGSDAIDIAASCGLVLDPWQKLVLEDALGERPDGQWAAGEVGLIVARQNGKGSILEAMELAGLFLWGEELLIHSAHEFRTAKEAFRRLVALIDRNPSLKARVKAVSYSKGEEGIELRDGHRIRFTTRTGGGGRGLTADRVILDEAYNLSDDHMAALLPTLSARPNPQIVYTTSAPDKDLAPCDAIANVRRRALDGDHDRLAYFEWSADVHTEWCPPDCDEHDDPKDPGTWAKANPGLGIRLSEEKILGQLKALSARGFGREVLSVGNYPTTGTGWQVIGEEAWGALAETESMPNNPVCFSLDINPERSMGAIGVAGIRSDGLYHVEVVDHLPGVTWMVPRTVQLVKKWRPACVVVGNFGPAAALIPDLEAQGVKVIKASMGERGAAAGGFVDGCVRPASAPPSWRSSIRHLGQGSLTAAVSAATRQKLGKDGAFVWSRNSMSADICPLVAVSQALWGFRKFGTKKRKPKMAVV
ncbi:hypothetical protein AB0I72_19240 [Nocardiopsis sp. NPDC049922]|uniref:hypothetical protein n=1 Tax=Nocardiopsis sp. NPDC049922 TaxID=3155157 RepID=UPI0033C5D1EF